MCIGFLAYYETSCKHPDTTIEVFRDAVHLVLAGSKSTPAIEPAAAAPEAKKKTGLVSMLLNRKNKPPPTAAAPHRYELERIIACTA